MKGFRIVFAAYMSSNLRLSLDCSAVMALTTLARAGEPALFIYVDFITDNETVAKKNLFL